MVTNFSIESIGSTLGGNSCAPSFFWVDALLVLSALWLVMVFWRMRTFHTSRQFLITLISGVGSLALLIVTRLNIDAYIYGTSYTFPSQMFHWLTQQVIPTAYANLGCLGDEIRPFPPILIFLGYFVAYIVGMWKLIRRGTTPPAGAGRIIMVISLVLLGLAIIGVVVGPAAWVVQIQSGY